MYVLRAPNLYITFKCGELGQNGLGGQIIMINYPLR